MKINRAVALAASGLAASPDRLSAIAQALALRHAGVQTPPSPILDAPDEWGSAGGAAPDAGSDATDAADVMDRAEAARHAANLHATQASHRLLIRTIGLLK